MILINLLPHREMARKRARQVFNVLMGMAVLAGVLISAVIYLWYQNEILTQQDRNDLLSGEISKLEKEIKEVATLQEEIAALKARQEAVENLQSDRNMSVHLLNEAVKQLPEGIYLSGIKQEGQNVLLTGVAQSNERVSELLRNLSNSSEWMIKPELIEIIAANVELSKREQRRVYKFTVRVQLQRPGAKQGASESMPAANKA